MNRRYSISFSNEGSEVCQAHIVNAPDERTAEIWFSDRKPGATVYGVSECDVVKPGQPEHTVPEGYITDVPEYVRQRVIREFITEGVMTSFVKEAGDRPVSVEDCMATAAAVRKFCSRFIC